MSKFSPTTVTDVPPRAGPELGCILCTVGDGTYLKESGFVRPKNCNTGPDVVRRLNE